MAGNPKDPGQKHSIRGAHPTRILLDACGMYTTDDNPGDSAPAADVEVYQLPLSALLPLTQVHRTLVSSLGLPGQRSSSGATLEGGVHVEIPCSGLHCQSSL